VGKRRYAEIAESSDQMELLSPGTAIRSKAPNRVLKNPLAVSHERRGANDERMVSLCVTMEQNEKEFFTLLDGHSRRQYDCFLAEMFLDDGKECYFLCFRPVGVRIDDPNRYACRHIKIDVAEMCSICSARELTADFNETLHRELMSLTASDEQ
jgi:hypothetical protein